MSSVNIKCWNSKQMGRSLYAGVLGRRRVPKFT